MNKRQWLIAEECKAQFYTGWWLYLRDRNDGTPNKWGDWGWQRYEHQLAAIEQFLRTAGYRPPQAKAHSQDLAEWFGRMFPKGLPVLLDEWHRYTKIRKIRKGSKK